MKYWLLVIYGFLAAAIILAILYFLGTPVKPAFDNAWTWLSEKMANINFAGIDISKIISENLGAIIGMGITSIATVVSIISLRRKQAENEKLLEQYQQLDFKNLNLETANSNANAVILDKTKQVRNLTEEVGMYTQDKTAEILQGRIGEMQTTFSATETELRRRIRELEEQLANPTVKIVEVVK